MLETAALIVAAGRGQRFGAGSPNLGLPKQYLPLKGEPILRHTLRAFCTHPGISRVWAAIRRDDAGPFAAAAAGLPVAAVLGGAARQDSVRLGLEAIAASAPDLVLIHDGARPMVSAALIDRVIAGLAAAEAVVPAVPVIDTLKRVNGAQIAETVSRDNLVRVQTPQGFRFAALRAAHQKTAGENLTDDAAVMERAGHGVICVPGEEMNIKVTTTDDLSRLQAASGEIRTGTGFDVHRLGAGDFVTLCGLRIPHSHGLIGHSDADVALHAATDAILGAIGDGDIGQHFPPTDPQWRGAPSDRFIQHAHSLVKARGAMLLHLDITIVCERPKVSPHRAAMVAKIAEILGIEPHRVSVKATTTEGLGFTGRGEGIGAQAVATVRL
ncbi:MAG: bifunctional 2-C-methyl-D-erythritol 4-phosphate cytidylyltransferase/2-C-methyl-D-erythritol 2,4-cyclodiphosphate synthase [Rhodospirillaceae bacterium]|nr:bifunctional 2-C-methyl-D-erythritol 4-phosphate cytidylyltransferase/2-C-methyl-D-erythritol 2,4-cyclodiphosphate synthase [Rhodospirillaceae bacterium]